MSAGTAVLTAATFVWLGMVLAISFLEAPLKFRAPDVTLRIGLGIGRIVFRALNAAEAVLGVAILVAAVLDPPAARVIGAAGVTIGLLIAQVVLVRPVLTRRTDAVLAGQEAPQSHAHYAYIALELAKVVTLLVTGSLALSAS
ncbi:hypothetical protein [Nocardia altamirensis]|uniref:hypothetical protein n=1 Tax=Nocardia altamirensis TaxID=472158 RepID=UPI0008400478|nr:hypothetical protein [Nocardia altamirensis]